MLKAEFLRARIDKLQAEAIKAFSLSDVDMTTAWLYIDWHEGVHEREPSRTYGKRVSAGNAVGGKAKMKKYEFTGEVKYISRRILHRIRAVRDIPEYEIKSGDMGGWLETEKNLSHDGSAWVTDSAAVMDVACVTGDACVMDSARVTGKALVTDSADYIAIGAIGSRDDTTTFYCGKDGKIYVSCGCFSGSIDDFAAKVKEVHAGTKHERTYLLAIELAKAQIGTTEEEDKC